jgi:hypothetical protein
MTHLAASIYPQNVTRRPLAAAASIAEIFVPFELGFFLKIEFFLLSLHRIIHVSTSSRSFDFGKPCSERAIVCIQIERQQERASERDLINRNCAKKKLEL